MAYSGTFRPSNPQKYVGDYKNIIYRSSWECRVMNWLDKNPSIVSWASEEVIIPYVSPVDGRWHRYFPDFVVKVKDKNGVLKTMMLEVKPKKQTKKQNNKDELQKDILQRLQLRCQPANGRPLLNTVWIVVGNSNLSQRTIFACN
jgi:hypothetical protein